MRRLTRQRDERGAVSVVVALLMVPLMGFAAISIDTAGLFVQRQQMQAAADAAALAVAQDCSRGDCGTSATTAQTLAGQNAKGAVSASLVNPVTPATGSVQVRTSSVKSHLFAPVLGTNQTTVSASAKASWGAPSSGIAVLPLTFSYCEFLAQTGGGLPSGTTERTIRFTKTSNTDCTGPSGNVVPGGFGWVDVSSGPCNAKGAVGVNLTSSPGNSPPSNCSPGDMAAAQNQVVLLPIFDLSGGSGNNAYYRVYAYAAFKITGYHFAGQYSWNAPCSGNSRCIRGTFTSFVDLNGAFAYSASAPKLGAAVVALTG